MAVTCANCGKKITSMKNIFEGLEPSYICPRCGYEGYVRGKEKTGLVPKDMTW
jgi:DNA-directed RNA polymerase subunit RPC12/RpoP